MASPAAWPAGLFRCPLPRLSAQAAGDPRASIEERYASREDYLEQVARAALDLVAEGYLLEEDVAEVVDLAGRKYDYFVGDGGEC